MRKVLIFAGLLIFSCNLFSQNVNDDISSLQKTNSALKTQLKTQKSMLLKQKKILQEQELMLSGQINTADSIINVLQTTNAEVKKSAKNQTSLSQAVTQLKDYDGKVKEAFAKRKLYAMIAAVIVLIIALVYLIYAERKVSLLKKSFIKKTTDLNDKITNLNNYVNEVLPELEKLVEKNKKEVMVCLEKHESEDSNRLQNVTTVLNEKVETTNESIIKKLEVEITEANRDFNKQLVKFVDNFNIKIKEANKCCNDKYATAEENTTKKINELAKVIEKLK